MRTIRRTNMTKLILFFRLFFCERPRKRDLSYAFPQLKNRSKVRNFMPLHLCISPVLHSFIRAYSTFTNSKYGGSSRRNSQKLLHSAYISRLVFLSFPPYYFHFSSEAISNRAQCVRTASFNVTKSYFICSHSHRSHTVCPLCLHCLGLRTRSLPNILVMASQQIQIKTLKHVSMIPTENGSYHLKYVS